MPPQGPRKDAEQDGEIDFLLCRQCSTPCYIFEIESGRVAEAQCLVCGNDDPAAFAIGDERIGEDD